MKKFIILPFVHIFYYLLTALWPFVHMESFMAVTGPKTDIWLVKTVSLLLLPYILHSVCYKGEMEPFHCGYHYIGLLRACRY